jgi:hypothetical protein
MRASGAIGGWRRWEIEISKNYSGTRANRVPYCCNVLLAGVGSRLLQRRLTVLAAKDFLPSFVSWKEKS